MVKNNLNNKRAEKLRKQTQTDLTVNRLMAAIVLAVVGVMVMLGAGKSISSMANFITYGLPVLMILSVAALAAAILLFVKRKKAGVNDSERVFTKENLLGAAIALCAVTLVYCLTFDAKTCIIAIIAACLLYIAYSVFRKDFFLFSAATALGVLALETAGAFSGIGATLCFAGAAVVGICSVVVGIMLAAGKGELKLGAKKIAAGNGLVPMLIAGILAVAGGALGFIGMTAFITYVVAALLVAYLAVLIVYTIKMM